MRIINIGYSPNVRCVTASGLYQYDHGAQLRVYDIDSDTQPEFQFGIDGSTTTISAIPTFDGEAVVATIPDVVQMQARQVWCYVYIESENSGYTTLEIRLPIIPRPKPSDYIITPEQEANYNALLAQLNTALDESAKLKDAAAQIDDTLGLVEDQALNAKQSAADAETSANDAAAFAGSASTSAQNAKDFAMSSEDAASLATSSAERAVTAAQEAQISAPSIVEETTSSLIQLNNAGARPVSALVSEIVATQAGSGEPSPENVRTITGWDSVSVHRTGQNLVSLTDYTTTNGHAATVITADVIDVVTPSVYDYGRIPVSLKGGVTYTLVIDWEVYGRDESATNETRASHRLNAIDVAQLGVAVVTNRTRRIVQVYRPEADADTFLQWNPNYGSAVPAASRSRVMLLVGEYTADTAPAFVPGECAALTAALPETVYGGTLDWVTGVLTVTHGLITLDGTEAWGGGDGSLYYLLQGIPRAGISAVPPMCSHYLGADVYHTSQEGVQATSTKIWLRDSRFVADAAGLAAWFAAQAAAGTPVQIVYQLAEPYTAQIAPQTLATLQGKNNIWSNCGDTTVTYVEDTKAYVDELLLTLNSEVLHKDDLPPEFTYVIKQGEISNTISNGGVVATNAQYVGCIIKAKKDTVYKITVCGNHNRFYVRGIFEETPANGNVTHPIYSSGSNADRTDTEYCIIQNGEGYNNLIITLGVGLTELPTVEYIEGYNESGIIRFNSFDLYTADKVDELIEPLGANNVVYVTDRDINNVGTTAEVYALYDTLMEKHPEYITKNELGQNSLGTKLYEYVFTSGDHNDVETQRIKDAVKEKPVILVLSGVHGYERSAVMATYQFFRDMADYSSSLFALREGVAFKVIPVVTPYAFDNDVRVNENGVNINRNFNFDWELTENDGNNYSGASAADQLETQIVQKWFKANPTAYLCVDHHNSGYVSEVSMIMGNDTAANISEIKEQYLHGLSNVVPFWKSAKEFSDDLIFAYTGTSSAVATLVKYSQNVGITSIAMETSWNQNATGKHSVETIAVCAEAFGNMLLEIFNGYGQAGVVNNYNLSQLREIILNAYPELIPNDIYSIGGLQPDTGSTNGMTTRWRTDYFIPVDDYVISAQDGVVYTVFSYKVDGGDFVTFLGMSDNTEGISLVSPLLKDGANAFAVRGAFVDNRTVTEDDFALLKIHRQTTPSLRPRYERGSIVFASGVAVNNASRSRTDYLPAEQLYVVPDEGYKFSVIYYDATKSYLSSETADWLSEPRLLTVPSNAVYLRVVAAYDDDRSTCKSIPYTTLCCGWHINLYTAQSTEYLAACLDSQSADPYTTYVPDVPENIGVLNTILNMKQMADIRYTPLAVIPQKTTDLAAGTTYKGMVYSSSRPEMGFVPNCVSLHTFMTAVQNPNSYLYTVDLGELGNENGHTYYGSVCSTMICAALGIKEVYQTAQWADIPGMKPLDWQSPHALKLGDVVCTKAMGHVLMVTDITRNKRGKIGTITTMETGSYLPYTKTFTPDEFEAAYPTASWVYYRYERIHESKHMQSPYVAVEDEVPQTVVYNTALIPRKGDKANWLAGVPVEIDVLEAGNYTSVEVYKDDALYSTVDIAALITLADLPYGSYKARLTDGTNTSDWCYWMVVDAISTVTTTGNAGEIKVDFSASNATPVYVTWCRAEDNYPRYISTPTADELAAGSAVCVQESGSFKVRVAFETEYGVIHTVLPDAVTVL